MSYRDTDLSSATRHRPDEARARILAAFTDAGGNAVHAAKALDCAHRTLMRWVKSLGLGDDVEAIRARKREANA